MYLPTRILWACLVFVNVFQVIMLIFTIYCISSKEFLVYLAPHDCGDYEVWVDNRIICPPDSCYTRFIQPPCMPSLPSDPPNPGCQCIDGYLRNDDRVCIPRDQCVPRKQNHDLFYRY